jgi:hypothetical protein
MYFSFLYIITNKCPLNPKAQLFSGYGAVTGADVRQYDVRTNAADTVEGNDEIIPPPE